MSQVGGLMAFGCSCPLGAASLGTWSNDKEVVTQVIQHLLLVQEFYKYFDISADIYGSGIISHITHTHEVYLCKKWII